MVANSTTPVISSVNRANPEISISPLHSIKDSVNGNTLILTHTLTLDDGRQVTTKLTYDKQKFPTATDVNKLKESSVETFKKTVQVAISVGLGQEVSKVVMEKGRLQRFNNETAKEFEDGKSFIEYKNLDELLVTKIKEIETKKSKNGKKNDYDIRSELINSIERQFSKIFPSTQRGTGVKGKTNKPTNQHRKNKPIPYNGAGVLPYHIDNKGEAWVLISQENAGRDKGTWCDFGGKRDKGETTVQTAARECWEESHGILGSQANIKNQISKINPIGLNILGARGEPSAYALYLMEVKNKSNITDRRFQSINNKVNQEKSHIAWVKADELFKSTISVRRGQPAILNDGKTIRPFLRKIIQTAMKYEDEKKQLKQKLGYSG